MSFLTGLLADLLEWAISKLVAWIGAQAAELKHEKEVGEQAQQSVQPLKDAKTPEQVDDATKDALDHL